MTQAVVGAQHVLQLPLFLTVLMQVVVLVQSTPLFLSHTKPSHQSRAHTIWACLLACVNISCAAFACRAASCLTSVCVCVCAWICMNVRVCCTRQLFPRNFLSLLCSCFLGLRSCGLERGAQSATFRQHLANQSDTSISASNTAQTTTQRQSFAPASVEQPSPQPPCPFLPVCVCVLVCLCVRACVVTRSAFKSATSLGVPVVPYKWSRSD